MSHRLDPLLRPRSIAVIGASEREHSVGRLTLQNLQTGGFSGPVYPVNPGRDSVLGLRCYSFPVPRCRKPWTTWCSAWPTGTSKQRWTAPLNTARGPSP